MTLVQRRRSLMTEKKPRLPIEYQEVEWIGVHNNNSSNSSAYLELAPALFKQGYSATIKVKQTTNISNENGFFGRVGNTGYFELYYNGGEIKAWGAVVLQSVIYGEEFDVCVAIKKNEDATLLNLLTYRPDRYLFAGRVFGATFCDAANNVVGDLVPCYKVADGVIGMYDLINNVFYTNAGTGSFSKGADV